MSSITLTSITLGQVPIANQNVNVKYRLTSDPDVAASYTDLGFFVVKPNGDFVTPVVINGLPYGASYSVWVINVCANSSFIKAFSTPSIWYNAKASQLYTKNDCTTGFDGTTVNYIVAANAYSSTISQADADSKAAADIAANGQTYANANGACVSTSVVATLLVDYYTDTAADLCMYCSTPGVSELNQFVASTANGGPMQLPNDGSDPAVCYLLSSDKLVGPPVRRFGINLAYFINKYPAIDHFTFVLQGRSASAAAVSGIFAKRNISLGHLIVEAAPGGTIPSVSGATTADIVNYSSHITAGTDGSVGVGVGSPVLTLDYIVSTDTMTPTTY